MFKFLTKTISIDIEKLDTQNTIETRIQEQVSSLLKKEGTIVVPNPKTGDYVIKNKTLELAYVIRVSTNRIITSTNGVNDNATYSPIVVEAIKNVCDNYLTTLYDTFEMDIQNTRLLNLDVIKTKLNSGVDILLPELKES